MILQRGGGRVGEVGFLLMISVPIILVLVMNPYYSLVDFYRDNLV